MDVTTDFGEDEFEDLVGAYALDACEPDEVDAIERYIAAHPRRAGEVERLRDVAAGLGAAGASVPPVALRDRLLLAASERVPAAPPDEALRRETERFDLLLDALAVNDLSRVTHNGLTVRELVQHVEVIDRAFVTAAADPAVRYIGGDEVAAITATDLTERSTEPFAHTVRRFRATRARLLELHGALPAGRRVAGYLRDDTLVIRAFETWTHHDDIRRALGRETVAPDGPVIRAMAELAARTLPLALSVRGVAHPGRRARVVLTGEGGGDWTIACAPGEEPAGPVDVVVRADVVEWCLRIADRLAPADVALDIDGDDALAHDLVGAADAFAAL